MSKRAPRNVLQDSALHPLGESEEDRSNDPNYITMSYLSASLDSRTLSEPGSPLSTPPIPFDKLPRKTIPRQERWFQTKQAFEHGPFVQQPRRQYHSEHSSQRPKRFTAPSLQGISNGFLKTTVDIVRRTEGRASSIRAGNSDVILHTPDGLYAVILGNIYVNHAPFQHLVPSNECIVGPICEYSVHAMIYCPTVPYGQKYKLMIPHILKNVDNKVKYNIRVRYGNIHSKVQNLQVIDDETQKAKVSLWTYDVREVDKNYVTISTSHFSGFIVTLEGINCCSGSANILLFGALTNIPDIEPLVTLKVYMSSTHSQIKDYESALRKREQLMNRCLLNTKEIQLSTDVYDSSRSSIKFTVTPRHPDRWTVHSDLQLTFETQINKALKYNEGHICKRSPTDVADFYLEASDEAVQHFRGLLCTAVRIAKPLSDIPSGAESENSKENQEDSLRGRIKYAVEQSECRFVFDLHTHRHARGVQTTADLTTKELSLLSRQITPQSMRTIAREYLDFEPSEIETLDYSCHHNISEFKFQILHIWKNKHLDNNREKLVDILEQAANDGLVDNTIIDDVSPF